MLIDTHVHITSDRLWPDLKQLIANCQRVGIGGLLNVCLSETEIERARQLFEPTLPIAHAAAMHPAMADDEVPSLKCIEAAATEGRLVAIGETGLDYARGILTPSAQAKRFQMHMELARAMKLPLIVHCRGAFYDFIELLDRHYMAKPSSMPGLLHCFSEGPEELKLLEERGWCVGFGGLITYGAAKSVQTAAISASSEHFVLETDCPYLTPEPHRQERNEPARVAVIAAKLALLRKQSVDQVALHSCRNARRLFSGLHRLIDTCGGG